VADDVLFQPGSIGSLDVPNRLVRAATSESMAGGNGEVTDQLILLYEELAANRVGLIITGHLYCHQRGKYAVGQTGIQSDRLIKGLSRLTAAVHQHGALIFAEISHAGSQSRVRGNQPLAPSPVPNPLTGADVAAASATDIEEAISAFAEAARRAVAAGFDGVHIHGANGYLISEFASPVTNRRSDAWGGSAEARDNFSLSVLRAVRAAVPADYPVAMKIGFVDALPGGLDLDESVRRAGVLVDAGLDAVEVSGGLMQAPTDSAAAYVAVDRARAVQDLLIHRIFSPPGSEAYFRPWADALRSAVATKIILVGGMRTTWMMRDVLTSGSADFVAMARPLIREPDLVRQIAEGREGRVDCTSCNLCLVHEGHHSLRCWRTPRRRLLQHARYRLTGGFKRAPVVPTRH
jgi:2,4-dienoyl-CoA reductase-like NADH-dependent reductase (Old Yellow Enzyme family)